jgi:protein-tyrosine phosphatase
MYSFKEEDNLYDWISCLDKDKIYFGPFPNQLMINKLLEEKFDVIVNLTLDNEVINESNEELLYKIPKSKYIAYGIKDNNIPNCPISYCSLVLKLKNLYDINKKIYIHCRGGHGRSGMLSVSLMLEIKKDKVLQEVIEDVNKSHIDRVILREKWKNKNMPFNYTQYSFLLKIHKNIYINIQNKYYNWLIFNDSIQYNNQNFYNIYELFINEEISHNKKLVFLKDYFYEKIKSNKDIKYKLYLTYLRKIILTDCNNEDFCKLYSELLYDLRNPYFINSYP